MSVYAQVDWNDAKNQYHYGIHEGNILLPSEQGQYPVLFLFHGMGASHEWQNNGIVENLNQWMDGTNIKPMVVVMPTLPTEAGGGYTSDSYFKYIGNPSIESYPFRELIDFIYADERFKSYMLTGYEHIAVAGASMGGAAALYAGVLYRKDLIHIGALSASQQLHYQTSSGEDRGWIKESEKLLLNTSDSADYFIGYGKHEPPDFAVYASNYCKYFKANGFILDKMEITEGTSHYYDTFNPELHAFLNKLFG